MAEGIIETDPSLGTEGEQSDHKVNQVFVADTSQLLQNVGVLCLGSLVEDGFVVLVGELKADLLLGAGGVACSSNEFLTEALNQLLVVVDTKDSQDVYSHLEGVALGVDEAEVSQDDL